MARSDVFEPDHGKNQTSLVQVPLPFLTQSPGQTEKSVADFKRRRQVGLSLCHLEMGYHDPVWDPNRLGKEQVLSDPSLIQAQAPGSFPGRLGHGQIPTAAPRLYPLHEEQVRAESPRRGCALSSPLSPDSGDLCILSRFLRSKTLDTARWRIYRPTTGALLLLTALHLCDKVRLWSSA